MNYVNLVQRMRACESEVAAQLLLEGWINRFQYTVGLDIGEQHDQANVVVVCKHFEDAKTSHVVFAQDLTASKGQFKVMDEDSRYADPFTYVIQHLNSHPYSLTKNECVDLIRNLRDSYNQPDKDPSC